MANKLKNMLLKSVDLVRRGANPDADIKLYKSIDGEPGAAQAIMKSAEEVEEMIMKSEDAIDAYTDILVQSFSSIVNDESLKAGEAREMMAKSLCEFNETVYENIVKNFTFAQSVEEEREVGTMANENLLDSIDKSLLSADEQKQLSTLLEKACKVKKEDDPMEDEKKKLLAEMLKEGKKDEGEEEGMMEKSIHPEVAKALERMESLAKSIEMRDMVELAKKYEPLGEKSEDLAKKLYDMKKSSENAYNEYVAVLEKSLDMLNKSGLFGEIGKSAYFADTTTGIAKSDVETKIDSFANEIMKSNPEMTQVQAIAKAWEDHPELAIEYENSRC